MSHPAQCSVCDGPINAYGAQGTRCHRCNLPCPVCNGDVAHCPHPLPPEAPLTGDEITRDTDPNTGNSRIAA